MTKITILRTGNSKSPVPKLTGKAGRIARLRQKSQHITSLWEKCVKRPTKVDIALNGTVREKKLVDIANYRCNKGKTSAYTVRAKQKRQCGVRELILTY